MPSWKAEPVRSRTNQGKASWTAPLPISEPNWPPNSNRKSRLANAPRKLGPGLGIPQSSSLWSTDSVTTKSIFATSYDLSALERRARLLSESLDEATDSVLAHRDLLESTPSIYPTKGWLSSRFSQSRMHPVHNRPLPHEGLDISAPKGTPILAAARGRVLRSGWVVGYGLTVEIDHGFGFTTLYGHG